MIIIQGRRWFQKSYGNTYHSVSIHRGNDSLHSGQHYGYGEQYLQTAHEMLVKNGWIADISYSDFLMMIRDREKFYYSVVDVSREKDL